MTDWNSVLHAPRKEREDRGRDIVCIVFLMVDGDFLDAGDEMGGVQEGII